MKSINTQKLLFVINPVSGSNNTDWEEVISNYFSQSTHFIQLFLLTKDCNLQMLKDKINSVQPHQVIAVGGDGTVKLVAECLLKTDIALGILPAGSANGLAKELGISEDPNKALDIIVSGNSKKIHTTTVNDQLCIHLSDIGLNAYAMKKFERNGGRGMWGYLMATFKVLWQNPKMNIEILIDGKYLKIKAFMIVIANGTMYGTGAVINPIGKLDDNFFEVIAIKQNSIPELFKMVFSHEPYDSDKTEVFQTNALTMRSVKKVHFQIDGEYLGKVREVNAILVPNSLKITVPATVK